MNKHLYRIVFNHALGLCQVVSELVRRPGRGASTNEGKRTTHVRPVSWGVWVAFGWIGVASVAAAGQITADPNAPGNQRPTVLGTPGAAALINIQTPSAAGVSRNTYSQFDVDQSGAVLNNSRTTTTTQLAGAIGGNPWLATGTAKIILNEVTGSNPSQLNGYIEVAGDRAQVIIANPAGITCNGCGFLNANRVTLTTGTPLLSGGALDGYRVSGGAISVGGTGLDASRADYTDIITRALQVNAGIWAPQLQVTTGSNQVSADQAKITPISGNGSAPTFAVDVSALGGMYSNKIQLVGTEHGVGVRNAGTIGAQAGELTVTVDGRLENTGNLQSQTDTQVAASGGIANAGTISAANTLTINTPLDLDNSNGTLSAARLDVTADSLRNQGGTLTQTGAQAMTLQAGAVSNRDGGSIGVPAAANNGDTGNGGSAAGTDPNTAGNLSGGGGATDAGGGPTPSVTPPTPLPDGALHIANLLNNDGGHITANAGFDLDTASGLSNDGGQLELRQLTLTSGNLSNNGGTLAIDGMATIHANSVSNDAGMLTFNGPLNLDAQQLSNRAGTIQQLDSGATSLAVAGTLDNTDGTLASNAASLAVASGTLINEGGTISHAGLNGLSVSTNALYGAGGRIATAGAMLLTAGAVDHRSATLSATQVTIHAASFDNLGGTVTAASGDAANTLTVTGTLDNGNGGTLASNGDLTLQANVLGNAGGTVQQAGNGALVIRAATLNGAGGMIGSNGSLTVTGDHTDLSGGTTVAKQMAITTGTLSTAGGQLDALGGDPLQLSVRGAFDNTGGSIIGNGALALSAASFTNTRGTLIAAGTGPTTLQVTSLFDNTGGTLASAGATTLHVGSLINAGGTLQASAGGSPEGTSSAAPFTLTVDGLLNNDQGSLQSNGDVALAAGSVSNHGGNVQTPGAIHATVAGTLDNSGGAFIAGADLVVQADSLLNRNTLSNTATTGLYGQQVTLNAAALDNTQGAIVARDALTVSGNTLGNEGGVIDGQGAVTVTGLTLDNTGGQLTQHGDAGSLAITIAQALGNTGGGMIGAEGSAQLHAGRFDNSGGTIVAQHDLSLVSDGDLLNNNHGLLQTQGALTLNANGSFDNSAGQVDATGAATIAAASISNVAGQLLAGDVSTPDAALQITTGSLDNRGGTLGNRGGDIALSAASIDNSSAGTLVAQRDLSVNTNTFNNAGGTTFATRNLSYQNANATLDNTHGQFGAGDTAWLNLAQITNNDGHLQADTLWLTTPTLNNDGGEVDGTTVHATFASLSGIGRLYGADLLEAHITGDYTHLAGQRLESDGVLSLTVDGTLTNQGTLQTPSELDITAANIINTNGAVINASAADGSAVANIHASGSLDNQQGASLEGDTLALTANTLSNTGNITGDAIRIDAATLTNGRDLGTATAAVDYGEGFIGAAQTMDLHVGSLANLDGQLYSGGDLTIAADAAGHQAQSVLNSSGLIQAQGNLNIAAQQITNQRRVFETEVVDLTPDDQAQNTQTEASVPRYRYDDPDPLHHPPYIDPSQVVSAQEIALADSWCASFNGSNDRCIGYPNGSGSATMFQSSTTDTVTSVTRLVSASAAGQLVSGGDMSFSGAVLNDKSTIAAGGNLTIVDPGTGASGAVQNIAWTPTATVQSVTDDQVQSQYLVHSPNRTWLDGIFYTYDTSSASTTLAMDGSQPAWITYDTGPGLPATVTGKTVTIVANVVTNGSASGITTGGLAGPGNTTLNNAGHAQAGSTAAAGGGAAQTIGNADGPLPGYTPPTNAMVVQHTDPGAPFLVTTAPRFAKGPVTSSNYLLQALGDDPANMHKRLGDGYYEQNLVMDQILQLTGRRSLNGSGDAMAQYTDLMTNAAQQASQLGLSLGAPLTSAQIGALTTDIVWLVDMVVDGQEVLTPVVYLSQATANHLKANGALIAGDQVAIQSSTTLSNAGSISSDHGTWLSADTLINTGAINSGGLLAIATAHDTINSGTLSAQSLAVQAGRDLITTGSITSSGDMALTAGRDLTTGVAPIQAGGNLSMVAGRNLTATASTIGAGGDAQLVAGNNLSLNATAKTTRSEVGQTTQENLTYTTTSVSAGGNLALVAGNNLTSQGAQLTAGNQLALAAGNDITLNAVTNAQTVTSQTQQGHTRTHTSTYDESVQGTTLNGANGVVATAGHDLTATAATISSANGNVALGAGHDLTLNATQENHSVTVDTVTKKSGLLSSSKTATHDVVSDSDAMGTTISGSNVSLTAGHDLTAQAAQVSAAHGLALTGGNDVNLIDAQNVHTEEHDKTVKKSSAFGSNLDLGHPGRKSGSSASEQITDTTVQGTTLSGGDGVVISAGRDVNAVAASVTSANGAVGIHADRDVNLLADADTQDFSSDAQNKTSGHFYGSKTVTTHDSVSDTEAVGTTLSGHRGVLIDAGRNVLTVGGSIQSDAGGITVTAGNQIAVLAANSTRDTDHSDKTREAGFEQAPNMHQGTRQQDVQTEQVTAQGTTLNAHGPIMLASGGDQTYQAVNVHSDTGTALISDGAINFVTATNSDVYERNSSKHNVAYGAKDYRESVNTIEAQSNFSGPLVMSAADGITVGIGQKQGETQAEAIAREAGANPSSSWLYTLQANPDVTWQSVDEQHTDNHTHQEGVSSAAAVVITAVVTYFTAGLASGAVGSISGAAAGSGTAMATAGTSAATGAAVSAGFANAAISGAIAGGVGGAVNAGSQGYDWKTAALHGAITGGLTGYLSAGTYYDNPIHSVNQMGSDIAIGDWDSLGEMGLHIATTQVAGKLEQQAAKGLGLNGDQLNWILMAGSIAGNDLTNTRYQTTTDKTPDGNPAFDTTNYTGIVGFNNRGITGLPFDVIDTTLEYQGLPDASVASAAYNKDAAGINQPRVQYITAHSLGTMTASYLLWNGLAQEGNLASVPFGFVAPTNTKIFLGDGDAVNGFYGGKLFNWNATFVPIPFIVGHPFTNYKPYVDEAGK